MPDTKGFDTPYTDYVGTKPSFQQVDTLGTDPTGQVNSADSGVTGRVSPVELPQNTLDHGISK